MSFRGSYMISFDISSSMKDCRIVCSWFSSGSPFSPAIIFSNRADSFSSSSPTADAPLLACYTSRKISTFSQLRVEICVDNLIYSGSWILYTQVRGMHPEAYRCIFMFLSKL
jgi:hypothetical protein